MKLEVLKSFVPRVFLMDWLSCWRNVGKNRFPNIALWVVVMASQIEGKGEPIFTVKVKRLEFAMASILKILWKTCRSKLNYPGRTSKLFRILEVGWKKWIFHVVCFLNKRLGYGRHLRWPFTHSDKLRFTLLKDVFLKLFIIKPRAANAITCYASFLFILNIHNSVTFIN